MELHKAIEKIVDQFGQNVLTEERFVNILADVYPNRDNPAVFGIIRTLVRDGYCSDLLACDKDGVQTFISKSTLALNKKNGYDKVLVQDILNALAVGCGVASVERPAPIVPTPPSKQNSQKPQKSNNQNPSKPVTPPKQTPSQNPKQKSTINYGMRAWVMLFLGYIGLFLSPFIILQYQIGRWYPFFTLCALILLHLATIVPCGLELNKLRPDSLRGGLLSGVILCALFCLIFDFHNYDRVFLEFWGLRHSYNSPSMFFMLLFLISVFVYFAFASFGAHIAGIDVSPFFDGLSDGFLQGMNYSGGLKWLKPIGQSIVNAKFMMGVVLSISIFAVYYYSLHQLPTWYGYYKNKKSTSLRLSRDQLYNPLSFADFKLSSNIDSCIAVAINSTGCSIISVTPTYSYNGNFNGTSLYVNEKNYSIFVDSSLVVRTKWDNSDVDVALFARQGKIIAIEFDVDKSIDYLVSLYKRKYGEPEEYYDDNNKFRKDYKRYIWTFKNGLIQIKGGFWTNENNVIYFDRSLEPLLEKEERDNLIRKEAEEKRVLDSISLLNKVREETERQERIKREEEHQKSIEQI